MATTTRELMGATVDSADTVPDVGHLYFNCARCMTDLERRGGDQSPREYMRFTVGITDAGVQVWCLRHNRNVALIEWARPRRKDTAVLAPPTAPSERRTARH
ncbi:hypothetical protein LuPra_05757 [Luteitalea pratensis]|uniref:Uncharacterized protein n=1 Tax=Luteitalea pratensis TaxID=1855912 RepID=A0A143PVR8_LUTPR|nr:hypothetical protein [Luteitalea pratensis]AMY12481.1 hypothetical protein LuPra_05757 [Luteitalea pratensis]